uniref:Retrotransposon Copia-like N-terminal domain-containing protein n=1 Tax=Salix viminalis TaxID=40686 RepID=A0A6N2NKD0_SALVM
MSSSDAIYTPPNNLLQFVSVKLEGPSSYLNWSSQVKDALSIHDLLCFIDGTESCPDEFLSISEGRSRETNLDFTLWNRKNWFVLVWMKSIISDKVLSMVYGLKTARQAWQGGLRCSDFIEHAKALADQLAAVGKPMDEADLISLVLGGLNTTYNPFVSNSYFSQREKSLSLFDFQFELFAFEALIESQQRSMQAEHNNFAMMAQNLGGARSKKKHNKNWQQHHFTPGISNKKFSPSNNNDNMFSSNTGHAPVNWQQRFSSSPPLQKYILANKNGNTGTPNNEHNLTSTGRIPAWANDSTFDPYVCQMCGKRNHMALDCFHRYDYNYQGRHPPQQLAAMAAQLNSIQDKNTWYADSGANQHIIVDIANLHLVEPYT